MTSLVKNNSTMGEKIFSKELTRNKIEKNIPNKNNDSGERLKDFRKLSLVSFDHPQ